MLPAKKTLLDLPDKMLTELALGIDDPVEIAARYKYDEETFNFLCQQPSFKRTLQAREAELEKKGEIFRVKARALADDLLENVYLDAKKADADPKTRLDAIKFLAQAGGVAAPVNRAEQETGPKFSITFKIGGESARLDFNSVFGESNTDLIEHEVGDE